MTNTVETTDPDAVVIGRSMFWRRFGKNTPAVIALVVLILLFVVGMGFRLSFQRHVEKVGLWPARRAAFTRYATLVLVGYVIYGYEFQWICDALVDIGFASFLISSMQFTTILLPKR